jgi:DNA end-binding protein Ku
MPRSIWSGSISFGLVNIPVKVVTAVRDKDIRFHMLHAKDGARIRFKRVCPKEEQEVANEDIVRGYEVARGQYVTFTDEELEAASPDAARTIDIQEFVDLVQIDPAYFEKPYYLVPDRNAAKPYALLLSALQRTGKVGLAKVVMRDKEYLVALRAVGPVLMMETMKFADEVVRPESLAQEAGIGKEEVDEKQVKLAVQLVESLGSDFDPTRDKDTHREKVLELVERKAAGEEVVREPEVKMAPKTRDILAALEESIAHARGASRPERPSRKKEERPERTAASERASRAKRSAEEDAEPEGPAAEAGEQAPAPSRPRKRKAKGVQEAAEAGGA